MSRAPYAILLAVLLGACRSETAPPPAEPAPPDSAVAAEADPTAPAAGGSLPAEPGGEPGVPGSTPPEASYRVSGGRCYVYPGWVAVVRPRSGAPGEDIIVAARQDGADAGTICANLPASPAAAFTDPASPNNFFGIVGDRLLVDSGTGPRGRTLRVVGLSTGAVELQATYEEPVSLDNGVLEFSEPVGGHTTLEGVVATGVNCPDAQEWFETGFGVGVNRVVRYRLSDGSREDSGDLVCVPLQ